MDTDNQYEAKFNRESEMGEPACAQISLCVPSYG